MQSRAWFTLALINLTKTLNAELETSKRTEQRRNGGKRNTNSVKVTGSNPP